MTKATAQQCHALTTYFATAVEETTGRKPAVNRNKARWGFESLLIDYTPSQARELIDYYIKHYSNPSVDWFLYNYEKVEEAKTEYERNRLRRKRMAQESAERAAKWRDKIGNKRG